MRVLVTGGAGFIGSHVVDAYLARGHEVTVLDDLSSGLRENVDPRVELVVADLRDPSTAGKVRRRGFDLLNHHAAQIDVRVSVRDPAADAELNVVGPPPRVQTHLDDRRAAVVLAARGGAAYGEPQYVPQDEKHPFAPLSPYGAAKLAIDHYLGYFRAVRGVRAVSLRYGNVYGPRQRKDGEAGVVAIFAGALLGGEPVRINGSGEQTRDYVYVGDVARANLAALELGLDGVFNVGTGVETSVNRLYAMLCDVIGDRTGAEHGPAKAGEQLRSVLDGSLLRGLASLPEPVPLSEGLRETVEWLRGRS